MYGKRQSIKKSSLRQVLNQPLSQILSQPSTSSINMQKQIQKLIKKQQQRKRLTQLRRQQMKRLPKQSLIFTQSKNETSSSSSSSSSSSTESESDISDSEEELVSLPNVYQPQQQCTEILGQLSKLLKINKNVQNNLKVVSLISGPQQYKVQQVKSQNKQLKQQIKIRIAKIIQSPQPIMDQIKLEQIAQEQDRIIEKYERIPSVQVLVADPQRPSQKLMKVQNQIQQHSIHRCQQQQQQQQSQERQRQQQQKSVSPLLSQVVLVDSAAQSV